MEMPDTPRPPRAGGDGSTVERVECFVVEAGWRNFVLVKVTTTDGVVGWGEGTLGFKEFAVKSLVDIFAERYVVGSSPFAIESLLFRLYQVEHNTGPVMYSAMAGLETALWDVVGKICGQPCVNLVGGSVRNRVKAYANGWYSAGVTDLGRLRDQAAAVVARGYRALKFDPFGAGGREIARSELKLAARAADAVRDEVGSDVDILIECHGRFSVGTAIEAIGLMQSCEPLFCEEPIPAHNLDSQAMVTRAASAIGARVATGEHTYGGYGFRELLAKQAAHVIQPDLAYNGGFLETKKVAAMAETHYVTVAPHNCDGPGKLAASIQLCANISNFLVLESFADFDVTWRADLVVGGETGIDADGTYSVPSAPGWGIEFDEEVIRAHPGSTAARMDMFADDWEARMSR